MGEYARATRHPLSCLLFLAPLLALYEGGVIWLGGVHADPNLRNGADAWLRWALGSYGLGAVWIAPIAVLLFFLARTVATWPTRPRELFAVLFGMALECGVFAALLWAVSINFKPLLEQAGIPLTVPAEGKSLASSAQAELLVRYLGAGIYEEVIFRLALFGILCQFFRIALFPQPLALILAAIAAALLFAGAHHMGASGEPVVPIRFAFRTLAGLYFTVLYVTRGFAVAVGAHAGYDIMVGVTVN